MAALAPEHLDALKKAAAKMPPWLRNTIAAVMAIAALAGAAYPYLPAKAEYETVEAAKATHDALWGAIDKIPDRVVEALDKRDQRRRRK
jgi:hypothetical protein